MQKYLFPLLCGSLLFLVGCSQPNYYVFKTVKHRPPVERYASANDTDRQRAPLAPLASISPSFVSANIPTNVVSSVNPLSIPANYTPFTELQLTTKQIRVQKRWLRKYARAQKRWQEIPSADGPATTSLVLGILSVVLGLLGVILGPIAISNGSRALRIIEQYPEEEENRGMAKAGKILGIIGTVLGGIVLLALIGAAVGG